MILAAENGLPVDMTNLPKPPQLLKSKTSGSPAAAAATVNNEEEWEVVNDDLPDDADRSEIFAQLEKDLRNQVKIATTNSQYFTTIGDVANATK
jgi:hypothetical protein